MTLVFRKITKRILIILNLIVAFVFLLACCNAFLPPKIFWFIAVLGLIFPVLLALVLLFLIFWALLRSRWFLLSLACLVVGYTNVRALVGLHFGNDFTMQKSPAALRVLTWNVTWFDEQTKTDNRRTIYREDMFRYIKEQDADILCFQEYVEPNTPKKPYNNKEDIAKLGYPYSCIAVDYTGWKNTYHSGVAIYSKLPILDTIHIRYPGPRNFRAGESLIGIDVDVNGQRVRVYTTHLQSVLFQKNDYRNLELIKSGSDSLYEASKSLLKKLAQGYMFRGQQVEIVRREVDRSPYPSILCGDFNDIPNSYTYFQLKGNRKDAFRETSGGLGRTFSNLSPTLRIDYIMSDKRFEVLQYKRDLLPYSDHYPVIADLVLPNTGD